LDGYYENLHSSYKSVTSIFQQNHSQSPKQTTYGTNVLTLKVQGMIMAHRINQEQMISHTFNNTPTLFSQGKPSKG